MTTRGGLHGLAALEGFSGAAVFTPDGELVAACGADPQVEAAGRLANEVLACAKHAAREAGAGRGRQVHLAGDRAHVLVRCLDEGAEPQRTAPGRAHHLHLVLVVAAGASLVAAEERMATSLRELADELRG